MTRSKPVVRVGFNTAALDTHHYGACVGGAMQVSLRMEDMPLTCKSLKSLVFRTWGEYRTLPKRMLAAWGRV